MISHSGVLEFCKQQGTAIKDCLEKLSLVESDVVRALDDIYKEMGETTKEKETQKLLNANLRSKIAEQDKMKQDAQRILDNANAKMKEAIDLERLRQEQLMNSQREGKALENQQKDMDKVKTELRKRATLLDIQEREIKAKKLEIDALIRDNNVQKKLDAFGK